MGIHSEVILACAYAHKGQQETADRYEAIVTSAPEQPQDRYLARTKSSTSIKLRMYRCMDDPEGYFATWRGASEPALSPAWLEFQQSAAVPLSGVARAWTASRPEAVEISADYRQLPERFLPALTRWQVSGPAGE